MSSAQAPFILTGDLTALRLSDQILDGLKNARRLWQVLFAVLLKFLGLELMSRRSEWLRMERERGDDIDNFAEECTKAEER